jgi:outer membrane protein assembly factor BamD
MVALLAACSGDGKKKEQQEPQPADTLYQKAAKAMEEEDYKNATKFFEEVERQHPYSDLSSRAQLMSAYASYLDQRLHRTPPRRTGCRLRFLSEGHVLL